MKNVQKFISQRVTESIARAAYELDDPYDKDSSKHREKVDRACQLLRESLLKDEAARDLLLEKAIRDTVLERLKSQRASMLRALRNKGTTTHRIFVWAPETQQVSEKILEVKPRDHSK